MKYVAIDEELELPSDVTVDLTAGKLVSVKGKKGKITKDFSHAKFIQMTKEGNKVLFHADFPRKKQIALIGTLKNILNNMILGVQNEYIYKMKIVYSHFPITVVTPKKGSTEIFKIIRIDRCSS